MTTLLRTTTFVASLLLLLAVSSAAQERVQIVRAEYGTGQRWVDVTPRVLRMVRGDRLDFRVSHDSLDADPAHGKHKYLRLQLRDERGQIREVTIEDLKEVHLLIGTGSEPTGALTILRAEYSSGPRQIDVTARLVRMVRDNRLVVRVNNDNMGGDPAERQPKVLDVWYMFNNRARHTQLHEKEVLELPARGDADLDERRLQITRAQYGADFRFVDVTQLLNSRIRNDGLVLRVNDDSMQADPAHGERKVLTVFYIYDGRPARAFVSDGDVLTLPASAIAGGRDRDDDDDDNYRRFWPGRSATELRVLQASWGVEGQSRDVTGQLNNMVRGNQLNLSVNDGTMGGDPAPGAQKRLRVIYMLRGLRYETNVPEGGSLTLP